MPLRFSGFEHNRPLEAAYLGEHNHEVLQQLLGMDAARIASLEAAGVLYADSTT